MSSPVWIVHFGEVKWGEPIHFSKNNLFRICSSSFINPKGAVIIISDGQHMLSSISLRSDLHVGRLWETFWYSTMVHRVAKTMEAIVASSRHTVNVALDE